MRRVEAEVSIIRLVSVRRSPKDTESPKCQDKVPVILREWGPQKVCKHGVCWGAGCNWKETDSDTGIEAEEIMRPEEETRSQPRVDWPQATPLPTFLTRNVTTIILEKFNLKGSEHRSSGRTWAGHLCLPLGSDVLAGSPDSSALGRQAAEIPWAS